MISVCAERAGEEASRLVLLGGRWSLNSVMRWKLGLCECSPFGDLSGSPFPITGVCVGVGVDVWVGEGQVRDPAVRVVLSPNHWTTGEFPENSYSFKT